MSKLLTISRLPVLHYGDCLPTISCLDPLYSTCQGHLMQDMVLHHATAVIGRQRLCPIGSIITYFLLADVKAHTIPIGIQLLNQRYRQKRNNLEISMVLHKEHLKTNASRNKTKVILSLQLMNIMYYVFGLQKKDNRIF